VDRKYKNQNSEETQRGKYCGKRYQIILADFLSQKETLLFFL
jgi:hypothetical protein